MCGTVRLSSVEAERLREATGIYAKQWTTPALCRAITGAPFEGFAQYEAFNTVWAPKLLKKFAVEIESFAEKTPSGERKWFELPKSKKLIILKLIGFQYPISSRLLTVPAKGQVRSIHDRMPAFLKEEAA
ncbi:MAG: hypothetical protein D6732_09460 [Methanobacteriota archaeon]|nr:MAG: hypothetical protein D6732_09460 [Euryarchaeota archaeon]